MINKYINIRIMFKQVIKLYKNIIKIRKFVDNCPVFLIPLLSIIYKTLILPINFRGDCIALRVRKPLIIYLRKKGWIQLKEIFQDKIYEKIFKIKKGDNVIDIGANVGVFTLNAAEKVGKKGCIVAVEPEPNNVLFLRKNVKNKKNVIIIPKAVGNSKKTIKLYISKFPDEHSIKHNYGYGYVKVKITTLDNIVSTLKLKDINFLKVDTEGSELDVLNGGINTLKNYKPNLVIEYHSRNDKIKLIKFLEKIKYNIKTIKLNKNMGIIHASL